MSVRRLVLTGTAMGLIAVLLAAVTPPIPEMAEQLAAAQRTADTAGPDALVVAAAGLLAWLVWAWGCLGVVLTAASTVPGLLGGVARLASHLVLPAGARRGAAVLLGLGLGVAAPLAGIAPTSLSVSAAAAPPGGVPDWPAAPTAPSPAASDGAGAPDWPDAPAPADDSHVVLRGDCLWQIAEARLLGPPGRPPTDGEIAGAVRAWWAANADVIGPDPDLLLPGQVLQPPVTP